VALGAPFRPSATKQVSCHPRLAGWLRGMLDASSKFCTTRDLGTSVVPLGEHRSPFATNTSGDCLSARMLTGGRAPGGRASLRTAVVS